MVNDLSFMFKGTGEIMATLGDRARRLRLSQNISQEALSAQAGVAFGTVRRLERGDPVSLDNFVRILDALGRIDDIARVLVQQPAVSISEVEALANRRQRKRATRRCV